MQVCVCVGGVCVCVSAFEFAVHIVEGHSLPSVALMPCAVCITEGNFYPRSAPVQWLPCPVCAHIGVSFLFLDSCHQPASTFSCVSCSEGPPTVLLLRSSGTGYPLCPGLLSSHGEPWPPLPGRPQGCSLVFF